MAQPTSVADDLGSDFYCTIFEVCAAEGGEQLLPRSSFAIQVKSSDDEVPADNKVEYLTRLEIPFFIGVVEQSRARMTIYSGEFLPLLFAERGNPKTLRLALVPEQSATADAYFEVLEGEGYRLKCPIVTTLSVYDSRSTLEPAVKSLLEICTRAHGNIATRLSQEHIYKFDGRGLLRIVAGSGSNQFFRENFSKRLGEVFYNLQWVFDKRRDQFSIAEFRVFESLYLQLEGLGQPQPIYVSSPYYALKARLKEF